MLATFLYLPQRFLNNSPQLEFKNILCLNYTVHSPLIMNSEFVFSTSNGLSYSLTAALHHPLPLISSQSAIAGKKTNTNLLNIDLIFYYFLVYTLVRYFILLSFLKSFSIVYPKLKPEICSHKLQTDYVFFVKRFLFHIVFSIKKKPYLLKRNKVVTI